VRRSAGNPESAASIVGWYMFLTLAAAVFLLPFVWMISTAFKTPEQTMSFPPVFIPDPWTLRSFVEGLQRGLFGLYFRNSLVVTSLCVLGAAASSSIAGFGFARLDARLKNFWFVVLLGTMMIPATVTLIPVYVLYARIGWINTILPLVVPSFLGTHAFNIFLMRQFFLGIPKEIEESALIDGCPWWTIFYRIFLPNARPALLVIGLFTFSRTWNDFFAPLIFLIDPQKYTVAVGLSFLKNPYGGATDWGPLMAMGLLSVAPVLILYVAAQRYFVQGIVTTGLKN
jgi:ABC-type glycerol-3-phosphate transport system permease component